MSLVLNECVKSSVNHKQEKTLLMFSPGILFANGENWKEMRRFALSNMREFGMGKKGSEEKIIEETRNLIEVFEKFNGTSTKYNVICCLIKH